MVTWRPVCLCMAEAYGGALVFFYRAYTFSFHVRTTLEMGFGNNTNSFFAKFCTTAQVTALPTQSCNFLVLRSFRVSRVLFLSCINKAIQV